MVGFDSVGQVAVGELSGEADTVIFAPAAVAVSASIAAVAIHGGASVLSPPASGTAAAAAPSIRTGVRLAPPSAAISGESGLASIEISATISVAVISVTVDVPIAKIGGGAIITVPGIASAETVVAPFVTAGKAQFPPTAVADVTLPAPGISISATLHPTTQIVTVLPMGVQILGGNYIEASNTIVMVTPYGEVASSSVAQFAVGEGEESSRIVRRGPLALVTVQPPFITAGKSAFPPTATIEAVSHRAEIDSRTRKLRILAIAA